MSELATWLIETLLLYCSVNLRTLTPEPTSMRPSPPEKISQPRMTQEENLDALTSTCIRRTSSHIQESDAAHARTCANHSPQDHKPQKQNSDSSRGGETYGRMKRQNAMVGSFSHLSAHSLTATSYPFGLGSTEFGMTCMPPRSRPRCAHLLVLPPLSPAVLRCVVRDDLVSVRTFLVWALVAHTHPVIHVDFHQKIKII